MRSRTLIHAASLTGTADGCLQTGEGEASGMEGGVKGSGGEERKEEAEARMEGRSFPSQERSNKRGRFSQF